MISEGKSEMNLQISVDMSTLKISSLMLMTEWEVFKWTKL